MHLNDIWILKLIHEQIIIYSLINSHFVYKRAISALFVLRFKLSSAAVALRKLANKLKESSKRDIERNERISINDL